LGAGSGNAAAPFLYLPYLTFERDLAYIGHMIETQVISMTDNAARRVAEIAAKLGKPPVLRLSVEGGGCSGFQYKFGMADTVEADDIRAEGVGASLVVDPVSLDLVRGSAIDFVESLGGKSFQVTNPQAQAGCGCGSSFSV
jgi:iron-sulfur cluster assembly accessory protein